MQAADGLHFALLGWRCYRLRVRPVPAFTSFSWRQLLVACDIFFHFSHHRGSTSCVTSHSITGSYCLKPHSVSVQLTANANRPPYSKTSVSSKFMYGTRTEIMEFAAAGLFCCKRVCVWLEFCVDESRDLKSLLEGSQEFSVRAAAEARTANRSIEGPRKVQRSRTRK